MYINSLQEQKGAQDETGDTGPLTLNAFDLIILSQGLNLATLFDRGKVGMIRSVNSSSLFSCSLSFLYVIQFIAVIFKVY